MSRRLAARFVLASSLLGQERRYLYSIQLGEALKLDRVDPNLARLHLRDRSLGDPEGSGHVHLGETGSLPSGPQEDEHRRVLVAEREAGHLSRLHSRLEYSN